MKSNLRDIITPIFEKISVKIMNMMFKRFTPLNITDPTEGIARSIIYATIPLVMFNEDNGTRITEETIPVIDELPNHRITTGNVNITAVKETENKVITFFTTLLGSMPNLLR